MDRCVAYCDEPPWYFHTHACPNRATKNVAGLEVCGTHARKVRRWVEDGERLVKDGHIKVKPETWARRIAKERWAHR